MPCLYVSKEILLKCKTTEFTSCLSAILFCFSLANVHTASFSFDLSLKQGNKHQSGQVFHRGNDEEKGSVISTGRVRVLTRYPLSSWVEKKTVLTSHGAEQRLKPKTSRKISKFLKNT